MVSQSQDPAFGLQAALPEQHWLHVREVRTNDWQVWSNSMIDTAHIARAKILECFRDAWPEEAEQICTMCYQHYDIPGDWKDVGGVNFDTEPCRLHPTQKTLQEGDDSGGGGGGGGAEVTAKLAELQRGQEEAKAQMDRVEAALLKLGAMDT